MTKKDKVYAYIITALASLRVLIERVRANKMACKAIRRAGVCLLAVLTVVAYTLVVSRYASNKAVVQYKAEQEAIRIAKEQEAIAAAAVDPYLVQLHEEATLGAKALEGVKGFHYDENNKRTILQCIVNRMLNPAYSDTAEEVLTTPGAFDFYNPMNPVLEEDYQLCYEFFDNFHKQERLTCSYELVFIDLGDKVVLRDTLAKGYGTNTWYWK